MTKRVHGRCKLFIPMKSNNMSVVTSKKKKSTVPGIQTQTPASTSVVRAQSMIADTNKKSSKRVTIPVMTPKVKRQRKTKKTTVSNLSSISSSGSSGGRVTKKGGGKKKKSKWEGKTVWDFEKKPKKTKQKKK